MKKILLIISVIIFTSSAYAQTTPESYLASIPALPQNSCNLKSAEKTAYCTAVNDLFDKMDKDIAQRKKESKAYAEANRDKGAANVMAQAGYEGTDQEKPRKMTREEKKALADKMMREQYGISMEETKKLKKMTKEEKTAWAQGYGADAAAKSQTNPQKYQEGQQQAKTLYDLQVEQKDLVQKINTKTADFKKRLEALDFEAAAVKTKEIDPLQREITSMSGEVSKTEGIRLDNLNKKLREIQNRYCARFSPQQLAILAEYQAAIKASLPDYYRLEEIIVKIQFGLDKPFPAQYGLIGIQAIKEYTALLKNIFKCDLRNEAQ